MIIYFRYIWIIKNKNSFFAKKKWVLKRLLINNYRNANIIYRLPWFFGA